MRSPTVTLHAMVLPLLFIHGSGLIFLILLLVVVVAILLLRKLFQFALYVGILILIVLIARALL